MKWLVIALLLLMSSSCTLIGVQKIGCEGEGSANCPLGLVCVEEFCVENNFDAGVRDRDRKFHVSRARRERGLFDVVHKLTKPAPSHKVCIGQREC